MIRLILIVCSLVALIVGGFSFISTKVPQIEQDLLQRAVSVLETAGQDGVVVEVRGRDLVLTKSPSAPTIERSVLESLIAIPGVRDVSFNEDQGLAVSERRVAKEFDYSEWMYERNQLVMVGSVLEGGKERLVAYMQERIPDLVVQDLTSVVPHVPQHWTQAMALMAESVDNLHRFRIAIGDDQFAVSVDAMEPAQEEELQSALQDLLGDKLRWQSGSPGSLLAATAREGLSLSQCQQNLDLRLQSEPIGFERGSAKLDSSAESVLSQMRDLLGQCPQFTVEIEGHTDSRGNETFNLELSQKRAESVRRQLVTLGVSSRRLRAIGYGESQPIADNDTEEGRSRNRRIEITLQPAEN